MDLNYDQSSEYDSDSLNQQSIAIKFGASRYEVEYTQIAYLFRSEGIFFLVDKGNLKLPVKVASLDDFPLKFDRQNFFQLAEDVMVGRTNVRIVEGLDEDIALAHNTKYSNKFKIPKNRENDFRFWLLEENNKS